MTPNKNEKYRFFEFCASLAKSRTCVQSIVTPCNQHLEHTLPIARIHALTLGLPRRRAPKPRTKMQAPVKQATSSGPSLTHRLEPTPTSTGRDQEIQPASQPASQLASRPASQAASQPASPASQPASQPARLTSHSHTAAELTDHQDLTSRFPSTAISHQHLNSRLLATAAIPSNPIKTQSNPMKFYEFATHNIPSNLIKSHQIPSNPIKTPSNALKFQQIP